MKHLFALLAAFVLLSTTCRKDEVPDPNSYYFRCKVNGRDFRPDNCSNCKTAKLLGDTVLIVYANNVEGHIGFGAYDHPVSLKNYTLTDHPITSADYDDTFQSTDLFKTDSQRTGTLEITEIDKTRQIIKGNFSFKAFNNSRNAVVSVTEGQFRLNYITY